MRGTIDAVLRADLHALYRHLHAHPELSMQEHATAALIRDRMRDLGYDTFLCGGTGVVGVLRNGPGPVVAFRADIDALPIAEATGLEYASRVRGRLADGTDVPVMHACGHDTHVVAAVGAAALLARDRATWSGTVVFVFQPGEEIAAGARAMLADGLWERAPKPEIVYGQHVSSGRAGRVELAQGPIMAMVDSWRVTVHGRGGHGSRPEQTIDPIVLAAHMVVRIQSVVTREVPAQKAAVVTVASFHGGLKENVIPDQAQFTINVRNLDADVRDAVLVALRRVILAEAQASDAPEPTIEELYTLPLLVNDAAETVRLRGVFQEVLGEENVGEREALMGSEDFGLLPTALGVPGVYWFFGGLAPEVVDGEGPVPSSHSPLFAPVLEPTLTTGVTAAHASVMSRLSVRADHRSTA